MITLFISQEELIASLILFVLLALYGWSKHSLAKCVERDAKFKSMSDEELLERFHSLAEDYNKKASYKTAQEAGSAYAAIRERDVFKNVPDAELISHYRRLMTDYETPTLWIKDEFALYKKEMKKRHLL